MDYQSYFQQTKAKHPTATDSDIRRTVLEGLVQTEKQIKNVTLQCLWEIYKAKDWYDEADESSNFYYYVRKLYAEDYFDTLQRDCETIEKVLSHVHMLNFTGALGPITLENGQVVEVTPEFLLENPKYVRRFFLTTRAFDKLDNSTINVEEPTKTEQTYIPRQIMNPEKKVEILTELLNSSTNASYATRLEKKGFKTVRNTDQRIPYHTYATPQEAATVLSDPRKAGKIMVFWVDDESSVLIQDKLKHYLEASYE